MKKTIFFIVITAIVLSAFFSTVSFAETEKPELHDASTELEGITCSFGSFYYSDDMLLSRIGSNEPSGELALASVAMANDAYEYGYISATLEKMHFNELYRSKYYDELTTREDNDVVAYTIAEKYVRYNNKSYRIIIIPIRGTPETCEWYSDFDLGSGDEHFGFKTAAWKVIGKLGEFVYEPSYTVDHTIIWTMGHSRGAAVANIVAGEISTGGAFSGKISKDHVFGYTFACPAVSRNADTSLSNIYNYNNPGDMVPEMPLSDWGFKRFGQTIELPASDYDNLCQRYKTETGEEYKATMTTVDHVEVLKNVAPTQDKFVNDDKIQLAVDMVAWFLGGKSDSEYDLLDVWISHPSARAEIDGAIIKTALAPKSTLNAMAADITVADLQLMMDSDLREYISLETELREAITETSTMSDVDSEDEETHRKYVEWCNWKNSHSGLISEAEDMTNVVIEKKIDISSAHTAAGERYEDYNEIASTIRDILSLFYDTEGNPAAAFSQGHPQNTYVLWINSMYYGYRGWYGNDSITTVNWKGRGNYSYVGDECFSKCNKITAVISPETIKMIGGAAFKECNRLESAVIKGTTVINVRAFYGNDNLGTAVFSGDGIIIEGYAFAYCPSLKEIQFAGEEITVGIFAFMCSGIKTLIIPDHIKYVNEAAFYGCENLKDLTTPYGDEYYDCNGEFYPFEECNSLQNLNITQGRNGEYYNAWSYNLPWHRSKYGSNNIKHVKIAEGVKSICRGFLRGSNNVEVIELPSTLERVQTSRFGISEYSLPFPSCSKRVIYHGNIALWCGIDFENEDSNPLSNGCAFYIENDQISNLVIPNGVIKVKSYVFYRCDGLTVITIPKSVKSIGISAFEGCDTVKDVYYLGSQSEWKSVDIKEGNDSLKSANIHFNETPIICNIHTWENKYTVDKEATCTEEGSKSIHCSVCNAIDEESVTVIPKAEHTYGDWKTTKEATCTADGSKEKICSACKDKVTETIKAPGHKWNTEYTVDKEATYAAAGSKSIHCSICDAIKPDSAVSIPKLKVTVPTLSKPSAVKKGFTAKWKKVSGVTGYEVQYALNNKFSKGKKTVKISKAATTSKKVTKLKAKKKYYLRIRAYKTVSGKKHYSSWSKPKTVTTK